MKVYYLPAASKCGTLSVLHIYSQNLTGPLNSSKIVSDSGKSQKRILVPLFRFIHNFFFLALFHSQSSSLEFRGTLTYNFSNFGDLSKSFSAQSDFPQTHK